MALCTIDKTDESFAIQRLEKSGLEYEICPINAHRLNLFFGKKECIDIVRLICNRPLNLLTPEEDFILGTMLGYDVYLLGSKKGKRILLIVPTLLVFAVCILSPVNGELRYMLPVMIMLPLNLTWCAYQERESVAEKEEK